MNPLNPLNPGAERRLNPQAPKGFVHMALATKGGNCGMVHEIYDSLFFSSDPSFPLEGKCLEEAKGCTGQSTDRMLHRYPDRQSAACVIFASYPWTHSAAADTKKRRPFQGAVLLPLFGYFCRNHFCFFFTGRFLHNLVNTDGEKGHQVEKDEGIGQGIVAFGNEVDNADFGEGY